MSEETQQPDSETPNVVRSPKNTERDLESEGSDSTADGSETVRELVVIDVEVGDSPKNDRPVGWLMKCRRLVRDYELLPETSATFVYLALIRIMVRRLA